MIRPTEPETPMLLDVEDKGVRDMEVRVLPDVSTDARAEGGDKLLPLVDGPADLAVLQGAARR